MLGSGGEESLAQALDLFRSQRSIQSSWRMMGPHEGAEEEPARGLPGYYGDQSLVASSVQEAILHSQDFISQQPSGPLGK